MMMKCNLVLLRKKKKKITKNRNILKQFINLSIKNRGIMEKKKRNKENKNIMKKAMGFLKEKRSIKYD
jgi:hypothetical protein